MEELRQALRDAKVDAIVVTAMDEVAWLYNLRGYDIKNNPVFAGYAIVDAKTNDSYLFVSRDRWQLPIYQHLNLLPGIPERCMNSDDCVFLQDYEEFLDRLSILQRDWEKVLIPSKYSYSGGASYAIYKSVRHARVALDDPFFFVNIYHANDLPRSMSLRSYNNLHRSSS